MVGFGKVTTENVLVERVINVLPPSFDHFFQLILT
jgi:hypothetical protein